MEVVHLHSAAALIRAPGLGAACVRAGRVLASLAWLRLCGVTVVWTMHDLEDHDRRRPRLELAFSWALTRIASGLLCHGVSAGPLLARRFHLSRDRRPTAVPHPCREDGALPTRADARQRCLPGVGRDAFVFLFLGSVKEYRGIHDLVDAFARMARPGLHLVIRGAARDPAVVRFVEAAAARCPEIDFAPGFVPEPALKDWMAAADIVTAPYRRILTSGSVALAVAHGRPVVAPRMGTIPEMVDEDTALLYDPGDAAALEKALARAVDLRDALPERGRQARARSEGYGWDDAARETAAFYRALRAR